LPGSFQIPEDIIQKLINSVWNKEQLPISGRSLLLYQFTKWVIKMTNNYHGISLLPTSYKMLSNVLPRLGPYIDEITGDHQCGVQCIRSTTDQVFCIQQILEKKWECKEAVHQLFIYFKKAYDSVRRKVL
jgi:hypothetical protein